jgi:O-antigen/teichoic acid export membrane protein
MTEISEFRLFTQRVGLVGLVSVISALSNMVLLPVLTKNMPLADFGIWSQVNVTLGLVSTLMLLGLPDAFTRYAAATTGKAELQERFYAIFFMILIWGSIIALLFSGLSKMFAAALFHDNEAVSQLVPLIILIHSLNILLTYYFRTAQKMKKYSLFSLLTVLFDLALITLFASAGQGILGAVMALLLSRATLFSLMLLLVIRDIGVTVPKFKDARAYLIFGLPLVPSILSNWVINSSDRFVINMMLGTASVAVYSPGYILGNIIGMFIGPIGLILPVSLSKYHDESREDLVALILNRSLRYYLALAIPSAFGLSLLSRPMLVILSTNEIASQGYMVTPFIAASMILSGITTIFYNVLALKKKTVHMGMIWMGAAILNLILTVLLVHSIGIIGAAIATLAAFAFIFVFMAHLSSLSMRIQFDLAFLAKSLFASLLMSGVILARAPTNSGQLLAEIGLCAVIYFVALYLLGGIDKEEINFFRDSVLKKS